MKSHIDRITPEMDLASSDSEAALVLPAGFTHDESGLWYQKKESDSPMQIAGTFKVLGLARDPKGNGWSILLAWEDPDCQVHPQLVPLADLIGDGADVFRPLVSAGLWILPRGIRLLKEFLLGLTCDLRVRLVKQAGWYNMAFVLPNRTIGDSANERIMLESNADAARYGVKGALQDWIGIVALMCEGNTRLVFACCVAFAGPLNDLLKGEGGGFHFVGPSSVGKSTLLTVAGSIYGGGGRLGFAHTWRGTDNGLESIARAHSGTLLALDEMGEADSRSIGSTVYMLINGMGKARATRNAELKNQPSWRSMVLSSGELGLEDKIAEGGRQARAGQMIRVIDVPADAGKGYGTYDDTKGMKPAEFSEKLKDGALRIYGTAGVAFIEGLASDPAAVEKAARLRILEITRKLLENISLSDGQAHRVAARFALVAVAGELARVILDLPWAEDEAERAAAACFHAWRQTRGGEGSGEYVAAMKALRATIHSHGESRFRNLDPTVATDPSTPVQYGSIRDLLGYRFMHNGELVWGFTATGWREVVGSVGQPSSIAKLLAENGVLATGSDPACRFAKRIDGRSQNLFAVKASVLEEWGA